MRSMQLEAGRRAAGTHRRRRSKPAGTWHSRIAGAFFSDRARFLVFFAFLLGIALTGGGSRSDIQSLLILRPAAVLVAAYALFAARAGDLRSVRGPLAILAALMLLSLLQLVPLPWSVWTGLPQRELVADASVLVGLGGAPRPLSLDPNRTWNTFFSLFVPLAAVLLTAIQGPERRRLIVPLLMMVGLLSAALGFLQAIGGNRLHFYDISHAGYPVGLFANKNHQSVLLLWLIMASCWFATTLDARRHSAKGAIGGAVALILVLFPLLVLTGSRAGLLLSLPALLASAWFLFRAPAMEVILTRAGRRAKILVGIVLTALLAPLLFVFSVLATSDRMTALSRLFAAEAAEDLRWQYLPIFGRMALDFAPFGSGFGSFEKVFNLYEPSEMLSSRYMNQAHNDLMQIAIEGGIPALLILAGALFWAVRTIWKVWRSSSVGATNLAVFAVGSLALWSAASLVDYPLRTPIVAMLVASLTAWLSMLSTQRPLGRST